MLFVALAGEFQVLQLPVPVAVDAASRVLAAPEAHVAQLDVAAGFGSTVRVTPDPVQEDQVGSMLVGLALVTGATQLDQVPVAEALFEESLQVPQVDEASGFLLDDLLGSHVFHAVLVADGVLGSQLPHVLVAVGVLGSQLTHVLAGSVL